MADYKHKSYPLLGDVIKQARIEKKLSRDQLAERAGISSRYLASIENNVRIPRYVVVYSLIRNLGISADRVFYADMPLKDEDTDQLGRLINQCSERDQALILALVNQMLNKPDHQ